MTPKGRAHLVREIQRIALTARKWQRRWASKGDNGLHDRSSRPAHCPRRSEATNVERSVALRRSQDLSYACIAERVGLSRSAVAQA